jgi:hypothetical protein
LGKIGRFEKGMMRPPIFRGIVSKSKIRLDNPGRFMEYLATFEGKRIEFVLRERRAERSNQQNAYYWSVVVAMLADHTGYSNDEMHENLKRMFLGQIDEHGLMRVGSTAKLKTDEFQGYIAKIVRWAAMDLSFVIPDPKQVDVE